MFDRAAPTYDVAGGGYHEHFGRRLVERAGVVPGHRVLDVACGHGAVLVPAARAATPGGTVLGGDLSPAMVARALEAVRSAGVRAHVEVQDAEDLPVPAESFDRVLCGFGLFFLPHPEAALAGFHRALAAGGIVAVSTWGADDPRWAWEDELFADLEVDRRAVVRPFDHPADLRAVLEEAGFDAVDVREDRHDTVLADADEWWSWKWSYSFRGVLEQLPPSRVEDLRRAADPHLAAMEVDGGLPLSLTALIATASR